MKTEFGLLSSNDLVASPQARKKERKNEETGTFPIYKDYA